MDWIEQWFGVAPDNGDGSLEMLITLAAVLVVALAVIWRVPQLRVGALRLFARLQRGDRPSADR